MKAVVNDGCIGCGLCEGVCPQVFRMGDSGLAEVWGEMTPQLEESAREAGDSCPVAVIEIKE